VAIVGALLILLGVIFTIDWSGDDSGDKPVQITGTTTTVVGG
jgi:hypothetical protein